MTLITFYIFFILVAIGIMVSRFNDPIDDVKWWESAIFIIIAPISVPIQFGIYANDWYSAKIK